ncbi:hypothetical protein CDAR_118151 [Caerostris darwini]|uniref:Transposase n=1 Tax=Caerostris darwini TaxID=1538125 RepID=A0AAV4THX2_9ARAC|nr:hypothetical protein CDAR_118151 [Caerostris darwini]
MARESLCGEECLRKIHAGIVQRCSELPVKRDSTHVRFTNLWQSYAERENPLPPFRRDVPLRTKTFTELVKWKLGKPLRSVIQTENSWKYGFCATTWICKSARERDSLMAGESLCGEECLREIHAGIVQRCSELPVKRDSTDVRFTNLLWTYVEREIEFVFIPCFHFVVMYHFAPQHSTNELVKWKLGNHFAQLFKPKTPGNMDFVQRLGDARVVERDRFTNGWRVYVVRSVCAKFMLELCSDALNYL